VANHEMSQGGKIAVHCHAGFGRTGTVIACLLLSRPKSDLDLLAPLYVSESTDSLPSASAGANTGTSSSAGNSNRNDKDKDKDKNTNTRAGAGTGKGKLRLLSELLDIESYSSNTNATSAVVGNNNNNNFNITESVDSDFFTADEAIALVRLRRPGCVEKESQERVVREFEEYVSDI